MIKTIALFVYCTCWSTFASPSAKQEHEMTKFEVLWGRLVDGVNLFSFCKISAVPYNTVIALSDSSATLHNLNKLEKSRLELKAFVGVVTVIA